MTKVPTMRAGIPAMTVAATALALSLGLVAPAAAVADVYPPWWVCMANGGEMRAFYQVVSEQDALDRFQTRWRGCRSPPVNRRTSTSVSPPRAV
ncbi:Hypothetical protein ERS075655_00394 [Mycobacteroides abscessus]|nr:Hypothetical protein ERS075655_00394 [Mycobacteroides abscessus]